MKEGKLKSGRSGKKVTDPKQAIAIGLSEARKEGKKVPEKKSASKTATKKSAAPKKAVARKSAPKKQQVNKIKDLSIKLAPLVYPAGLIFLLKVTCS